MSYTRPERLVLRGLALASPHLSKPQFLQLGQAAGRLMVSRASQVRLAAMMAHHTGQTDAAIDLLLDLIALDERDRDAIVSLGYLLSFHADRASTEKAAEALGVPRPIDLRNRALSMLCTDVALKVDAEIGGADAAKSWLDAAITPFVHEDRRPSTPLFFWHIPKCSGSSLSHAFCRYFYSCDDPDLLPHYSTLTLLRRCVRDFPDAFPYLSSRHMDATVLTPPESVTQFTILRDPLKRALSAWRQSYWAIARTYHFRIVPRYGSDWFFWPAPSLRDWIRKAPEEMLLAQVRTFSGGPADVRVASAALSKLGGVASHELPVGSLDEMLSRLGVPIRYADLPRSLNRSPRKPEISPCEEGELRRHLEREYELLSGFG